MSAALLALLTAIPQILADVPGFIADWQKIRSLFSPQTQAAIDALVAATNVQVDGDLNKLSADASAAAGGTMSAA